MTKKIAVIANTQEFSDTAQNLAVKLNLTYLSQPEIQDFFFDYYLVVHPDYIGLQDTRIKRSLPFYIDFTSGKMQHRRKEASFRKELLARTLGCRPNDNYLIVDGTTGLGRDTFILANLGFRMIALERSPIIYTLLENALQRAQKVPSLQSIVEKITLIHCDAKTWLAENKADVVYIDPMFPERQKSASVKKEMVILQDLLGKEDDAEELFELSLTCATKRVVVKRPRLAAAIIGKKPSFSLSGKSSRFDVYLTQQK